MNKSELSRLYIFDEGLFFLTNMGLITETHSHYAVSVIFSLDKDFQIETPDGEIRSYDFVALGSNAQHKLIAPDTKLVVLQFDPHLPEVQSLSSWIRKFSIHQLSKDRIRDQLPLVENLLTHPSDCRQANSVFLSILESIGAKKRRIKSIDPRIRSSCIFIRNNLLKNIRIQDLSNRVSLSETRFMHIFKEEIGIPVRRYILWQRLVEAIGSLGEGGTLTDAAYIAGFSDQSHMSRTVKDMLGVQASQIVSMRSKAFIHYCGMGKNS